MTREEVLIKYLPDIIGTAKSLSTLLTVIIIISLVSFIVSLIFQYKGTAKATELAILQLQLSSAVDSSIVEKLDNFIAECFNDYILLNVEYRQDLYWTEAEEKKMVTEVTNMVSDRLSSTMFKQLSVYYNEKAIPDVIANKIYELVIAYFNTKTNTPKETPDRV